MKGAGDILKDFDQLAYGQLLCKIIPAHSTPQETSSPHRTHPRLTNALVLTCIPESDSLFLQAAKC